MHHSLVLLFLALVLLVAPRAAASARPLPEGYLDVTEFGADPTGEADSTAALQEAINTARDAHEVCFFPAGTYRISDRLVGHAKASRQLPPVLMGSVVDPDRRAVIYLAPNSPGFGDPDKRKIAVHILHAGTVEEEGGNPNHINPAFVGIDIKIGEGNPGAVALRMQSAEGTTIQDSTIDLTAGGHTGIWGIPGSGGATHQVTIKGGVLGIDTRKYPSMGAGGSQPGPVVTGSTFVNQAGRAVYAATRGQLVLVGCRILSDRPGPVITTERHWQGEPFDGSVQMVDCEIAYESHDPANTVFEMAEPKGRSFHLDNCYVRNAERAWTEEAPANPDGWTHFRRLAVAVEPDPLEMGPVSEVVYVDGEPYGDVYVESLGAKGAPADLQSRHQWPEDFPTFETPGAANVRDYGAAGDGETDDWAAIQKAIDENEVVFFPKGDYAVSRTLDLRPDSKLIGVYHMWSSIRAIASKADLFDDATDGSLESRPLIRTANAADAETYIAFLHLKRTWPLAEHDPTPPANYALQWRCAGGSIVRHVEIHSQRGPFSCRPDKIAAQFYGLDVVPDPNHPQDDFPPGMWAGPNNWPIVRITDNGGGRWYNFWLHGRQGLRRYVPVISTENTTNPLHIYHMHMQQNDSLAHAMFTNCENVSIYGNKGEIKGAMIAFHDCDNVRVFGYGGMGTPAPDHGDRHLYYLRDCTDFLVAGAGGQVNRGEDRWVGGPYDRWVMARMGTFHAIGDYHTERPNVDVDPMHRPILYLRGDPHYVPLK